MTEYKYEMYPEYDDLFQSKIKITSEEEVLELTIFELITSYIRDGEYIDQIHERCKLLEDRFVDYAEDGIVTFLDNVRFGITKEKETWKPVEGYEEDIADYEELYNSKEGKANE